MISWWIGPSIVAICIKLWLLFAKRVQLRENASLEVLLVGFLCMNLVELAGFFAMHNETLLFTLLSLYYMVSTITGAAMLNLFMRMNGVSGPILRINWVVAGIMSAAFLVPNFVLLGVEQLGFSATRIPGPFYPVWIFYILCTLLGAIYQLSAVYQRHKEEHKGKQVLVIALGLAPFILSALIIVTAMALGAKINAGVILSLMICTFLFSLIWAESKMAIFKVLARVPNTDEHKIHSRLQTVFQDIELDTYAGKRSERDFSKSMRELERNYMELASTSDRREDEKRAKAAHEDALRRAEQLRAQQAAVQVKAGNQKPDAEEDWIIY